jgi:large subunit ribosomal protein L6
LNKIKTAFKSVTTGWFIELNLNGIGYKSFKLDDKIALDLGYSNLILYKPNNILKVKNLKNKLVLFSLDHEYVNNIAAHLQKYSYPDPYKGKGIVFKNQYIKLKKKSKT